MILLVLLTSGCATSKRSASGRTTTATTRTNCQRQDSIYHYIKDSVVVYVGDADALVRGLCTKQGTLSSVDRHTVRPELTADERAPRFAHGLTGTPQGVRVPGGVPGSGGSIERYHTEYRERVVTRIDTVYMDREVQVQLPPERYVPRAVRWLAWTGAVAIILLVLFTALRIVWRLRR